MNLVLSLLLVGSVMMLLPGLLQEVQNRALYIVDPENPLSPRGAGRPVPFRRNVEDCIEAGMCDRFNITTSDGLTLDNYLFMCAKPRAIIAFFHGNAGSIYDSFLFASQLSRKTSSLVVMADYRGYGLSDGRPSEEGLKLDAMAILRKTTQYAHKYAKSRLTPSRKADLDERSQNFRPKLPIIAHGHSLGAAVVIDAASRLPRTAENQVELDAVVLSNPFLNIREMILCLCERHLPSLFSPSASILGASLHSFLRYALLPVVQKVHWDNLSKVDKIECPSWYVAAHNDDLVPVNHTHILYARTRSQKQKTIYYDVRHNNVHDSAKFYWDYNEFLDAIIANHD